jgi:predicted nuclease with TOPRIM domain
LEVLAFEMEATIASLEEEVTAAHKEKEEAISRNESLASELEALTEKLNISNAEVNVLQEDASRLVSFSSYISPVHKFLYFFIKAEKLLRICATLCILFFCL